MIMDNLGLIEVALVFLLVVGFCAWQYISISRSQARDRAKENAARSGPPRHAEGEHALNDGRHEPVE